MSFINDYQYEQSAVGFSCEEGEQLMRVVSAEIQQTKTGKQMLVVSFAVSNSNGAAYKENFVEGDFFNKSVSRFFDAFNIKPGNWNFNEWKGKNGRGFFQKKEEQYQDATGNWKNTSRIKLSYFIQPEKTAPAQRPAPVQPVQAAQPQQEVYTDDPAIDNFIF